MQARPLLVVSFFACAVVLAHFLDFSSWAEWGVRSDLLHVLAFAALAYGAMTYLVNSAYTLPLAAVLTLFGTLVVGSLSELAQIATSRDADLGDLFRDLIGAASGVCAYAARSSPKLKIVFAAASIGLLVTGSANSILEVIALWRARSDLPLVDHFEDPSKRRLWRSTGARIEMRDEDGNRRLCAIYREGSYPGIARRLPGNWSGYTRFSFDADPDVESELVVRVHDREHDDQHRDRFNRSVTLKPGKQTLEFSMDDIRSGPKHRTLDLTRLGELVLFVPRPERPDDLFRRVPASPLIAGQEFSQGLGVVVGNRDDLGSPLHPQEATQTVGSQPAETHR